MNNLNAWGLEQTTAQQQQAERVVDSALDSIRQPLINAVAFFFENPISPVALMTFEIALLGLVRELGRGCWNACSMRVNLNAPMNFRKNSGFNHSATPA